MELVLLLICLTYSAAINTFLFHRPWQAGMNTTFFRPEFKAYYAKVP